MNWVIPFLFMAIGIRLMVAIFQGLLSKTFALLPDPLRFIGPTPRRVNSM